MGANNSDLSCLQRVQEKYKCMNGLGARSWERKWTKQVLFPLRIFGLLFGGDLVDPAALTTSGITYYYLRAAWYIELCSASFLGLRMDGCIGRMRGSPFERDTLLDRERRGRCRSPPPPRPITVAPGTKAVPSLRIQLMPRPHRQSRVWSLIGYPPAVASADC